MDHVGPEHGLKGMDPLELRWYNSIGIYLQQDAATFNLNLLKDFAVCVTQVFSQQHEIIYVERCIFKDVPINTLLASSIPFTIYLYFLNKAKNTHFSVLYSAQ